MCIPTMIMATIHGRLSSGKLYNQDYNPFDEQKVKSLHIYLTHGEYSKIF